MRSLTFGQKNPEPRFTVTKMYKYGHFLVDLILSKLFARSRYHKKILKGKSTIAGFKDEQLEVYSELSRKSMLQLFYENS